MKGTQKISLLLKIKDFKWDVYVFMVQYSAIRKIKQSRIRIVICVT